MIRLAVNDLVHGFRVIKEGDVPRLSAHYWQLRHEVTGATLYYTTRDDGQKVFAVGFRTLPEDDTGVFHILEHSCLDGSTHFPLKEPFVNLIKTSMAVDLNAMTYEDKTVYYFISTNEQDYMNLLSVYLDAVFHPLLLSDRRIFEKEAWHPEPDGEGGVRISGVVFNEMQGNDNQPDYLLWLQNEKQLFPDLGYHTHNSGGDPAAIPDLTYETFVETYERFYSTQNAVFYLSGDMELDSELAYIDRVLCEKGLSPYEKPAPAPLQAPVVSPDGVCFYQLPDTEETAGNTHLMLTYVTDADKPEEMLALSLLSRYLAENTESPLERAVLASGCCLDFSMVLDAGYRQPMLYFMTGKTDAEHAEDFRCVILDTLRDLVEKGFDKTRLADLVAGHETDCRRSALSVQTGFHMMESFMRMHVLYDDVVMIDGLDRLRACMAEDERYFEHLVEKYVLESRHWAMTRCIPSRTLTAERRDKMNARFAAESARLSDIPNGYAALCAHMEAFNEYLIAPDSPEAEASIPHLSPKDIPTDMIREDMTPDSAPIGGDVSVSLRYETETDGMVLAGLLFELTGIPEDDLFYAACLRDALFSLPTEAHTLPELSDAWIRLHALPSANLRVETDSRAYFQLALDIPEEKLADGVALLDEYIRSVVLDRSVLRHVFANAAPMRNNLIAGGNGTALRLATRTMTVSGRYNDLFSGVSAYRRYTALADHFSENADQLVAGMRRVWQFLTSSVRPTAYLIGSGTAYDQWKNAIASLSLASSVLAEVPDCRPAPLPRANAALTVPGEVNYCAEVYDLADVGAHYSPRQQVVNTHLYSVYFWDEIRAKGGAYGANAVAFRQGLVGFTSYRDPRVADTYAVFSGLPEWLDAHMPTEDEVGALIVSTMGSTYCRPRSPIDLGMVALNRYLNGLTAADSRADIEAVLSTTSADFSAFANAIRALREGGHGVRAALGGADSLRRSRLFAEDETTEL